MATMNWADEYQQELQQKPLHPIGAPQEPQLPQSPQFQPPSQQDAQAWDAGATSDPSGSAQPAAGGAASPQMQNTINTLGVAPTPAAPTASPWQTAAPDYTAHVQAIAQAPDPQSAAVAHDQLARTLTRTFVLAGHQVEQGENGELIVDGRPYLVAGSEAWNASGGAPTAAGALYRTPTAPAPTPAPTPAPAVPAPPVTLPTDPTVASPWTGGGSTFNEKTGTYDPATTMETQAGPVNGDYQGWFNSLIAGKPFNQQTLLDLEPILNQYGIHLTPPNAAGERTKIQLPDGTWVRVGFGEGHPVWIPQGGGGGSDSSAWSTPSPYIPGQIDPTDPRLETLGNWLATNPVSMNEHVVQTLQAKTAEEAQQATLQEDTAAKRFGYQSGLMDSPWLASERAANVRQADQTVIGNRRNIEIQAAQTNTQDLRASIATLGQIATQTKDRFALNESLKAEAARLNLSQEQFLQQLWMRMLELEQQDRQFGTTNAYNYDRLNADTDIAYWNSLVKRN